jgi:hypothetical protein
VEDPVGPRPDPSPSPPSPPVARAVSPPVAKAVASGGRMHDLYGQDSSDDSRFDSDDRRPSRPNSHRRPESPQGFWTRSGGVLPRGKVRMACFVVLALSLFGAGALCIMAVWDASRTDVAWKAIVTLAIIAALMGGFTLLNEVFGPKKGPHE